MVARTIAYVGNADSGDISIIELATNGGVTLVDSVAVPGLGKTPSPSLPLALNPDRSLLFAAVRIEPYAAVSFRIDPATGHLSPLGAGPLAASMAYISTDRTGRFLFGASYGGSRISVNEIDRDDIIGPPEQVEATGPNAHAILPDPSNRVVLSTSLGGDCLERWAFDVRSGGLRRKEPASFGIPSGSGPRHLVFSPDARFVYVLGELDATVHVIQWHLPSATPETLIQSIRALPADFAGKPWAADIHLTPDGRFLYASERTGSTLAAFRVNAATGRLTLVDTYPTETQPRGFAIDPSGRYLLAVGQLSNRMTSYVIDPASGALAPVATLAVGQNPNWVEIIRLP